MNERIKELALEVFSFKYKTNPNELNPGHHMDHIHRFAELIVQDCMACSTWVGRMNKTAIEPVHTAYTINQRIKEHFGVE